MKKFLADLRLRKIWLKVLWGVCYAWSTLLGISWVINLSKPSTFSDNLFMAAFVCIPLIIPPVIYGLGGGKKRITEKEAVSAKRPDNPTPAHLATPPQINKRKKPSNKPIFIGLGIALVMMMCVGLLLSIIPVKEKPLVEGIDSSNNSNIVAVLNSCGVVDNIHDIDSIDHDELLDDMNIDGEKGYRVSANGINNIILYMADDAVNMIRYADVTLYENGMAVDDIHSYVLTDDEVISYYTKAEKVVTSILKTPSSAEFGSINESYVGIENGIVTVQCYVDSQNAFGAMLRTDFQVQFQEDTPISLIVDGTEYLK